MVELILQSNSSHNWIPLFRKLFTPHTNISMGRFSDQTEWSHLAGRGEEGRGEGWKQMVRTCRRKPLNGVHYFSYTLKHRVVVSIPLRNIRAKNVDISIWRWNILDFIPYSFERRIFVKMTARNVDLIVAAPKRFYFFIVDKRLILVLHDDFLVS